MFSGRIVEEQPFRAELFSVEQFVRHAKRLAQKHEVSYKKGRNKLLLRLTDNARVLAETHALLNEGENPKKDIAGRRMAS